MCSSRWPQAIIIVTFGLLLAGCERARPAYRAKQGEPSPSSGPAAKAVDVPTYRPRTVIDLAGTWEARSAGASLAWPPPADGWKPHAVPHSETRLITSDHIGPYFPRVDKVVDEEGGPRDADRSAAWFRRTLTMGATVPKGMRARLCCDGIAWRSEVRLNGTQVGASALGLAPNVYDVTEALKAGNNELVIGATSRAALWDRERQTFVAPIAGTMPGIYDGIRLEIVPELRIDDVFARTYVERERIELDVTVTNDGPGERAVALRATIRDPMGITQLSLSSEATKVPGGKARTITLGAPWRARHLWSPGTPNLYRALVELGERGAITDRADQPFGFREFTAKGRDFLMNGRRQVLLRTSWLTHPGAKRDRVMGRTRDEVTSYNCIRLHLGQNNPHVIDQADRTGLMIIPEFWGWYRNDGKAFPITKADAWRANAAETMRRVVRRYRNNPSIIMWSLANETFWNDTSAPQMAVADELVKTVRAVDPTRLLQGDAEITWDGRLDAICIHYPEGDAASDGKRYVNSGWVVPNDLAWLKSDGVNRSWRAEFTWDRPLMIGEFYAPDGWVPERGTPYMGDDAYDLTKYSWRDLTGRDALMPRGSGWIDMVKMSTDHYRAAGVACLNPWTGIGAQTMPKLLVAPLDYFASVYGGEKLARRFFVANDDHQSYNDIHVQAGLFIDGREVWSERKIRAHVSPGQSKQLTITIEAPAVRSPAAGRLIVRLCWMRGPRPTELCRHEEDLFVMPRARLDDCSASAIALVDTPDGEATSALRAMGLRVQPGPGDDAALGGKRLLIVGEGAASRADLAAAARFAARGGRVLVLHQTAVDPFVPFQPEIDPQHAATFSWRVASHPALDGLTNRQLRFWRPDHAVVTETFVRPSTGAAEAAASCGGRYGMHWSPLVELRHGRGAVTFCQYLLAGRASVEPSAGHILARLVRSGATAPPADEAPPLRVAGEIGDEARAVLASCSVSIADDLDGTGPVMVDARHAPDAATITRIRRECEAGGIVWLRGLDEKTAASVAPLLPWPVRFRPVPATVPGAIRRSDHPLIDGIGSSDLYWARGDHASPTARLSGPAIVPPELDAAVLLAEPAVLAAVPVSSGWVLVDQLRWETAFAAETERVTRIVSCLARNAGAGFVPPADANRRFSYRGIDLAKHANRGYVDEVAGDGRGGWTDQGDNDMRYFLTNHTGMVNGMAVAVEPFPARARFDGVPFDLAAPAANGGKAVIAFNAGGHDPAAPTEVRGIAAGGAKASRIWFLHAGAWPTDGGYGALVAKYEVVYEDGTRTSIPVRQGQEISDWWNPKPLSGARVAWSGRNAKHAPVGIYVMPWTNPSPEKPIRALDVVAGLGQTQLVLLAVTFGVEQGDSRLVAEWDMGRFADGTVAPLMGGAMLKGSGERATIGARAGVRFVKGQRVSGRLGPTPLADASPVAIEVDLSPDAKPSGYYGGLVEVGSYQRSGLRIVLRHDLCVVVEHWAGAGPKKTIYLQTREPLPVGRLSTVRYEHDGTNARLLVNGKARDMKACGLAAPYDGGICIGVAGGKDYFFNGIVSGVRIYALK